MNREGPKALGSRAMPVGKPNCFVGKTFVQSGELETLTREQVKDLIMRYGGRVTSAVSGKTTYLLKGRDAGATKTAKAEKLGTTILDEEAFYVLFDSAEEQPEEEIVEAPLKKTAAKGKASAKSQSKAKSETKYTDSSSASPGDSENELWVDKYRPQTIKEIVGNKEMVRKISAWLENWQDSLANDFKSGNDGNDNIEKKRAVLLSGPPGIGKTTTALVVANTYGYEPVELNASDARSKKILQESISEMIDNRSVTEFFKGEQEKKSEAKVNRFMRATVVLIMDEVDGMSGGDRGGSAELAALIRKTKIPVICICNDVRSDKVKPLLNVCYDARFKRTPANQVRSRLMTIAHREGLKVESNAIDQLVEATHNDLRQIINILSTYKLAQDSLSFDEAKALGKSNQKYTQLSVFDIAGALLSRSGSFGKSLSEKSEYYYHDYNLAHLMIFENYLSVIPAKAEAKTGNPFETEQNEIGLFAKAAESIADGDLVDSQIHGTLQQYSLMPVHSILSCVRPAFYIEGRMQGMFKFPSWLGQNSKTTKHMRMLNDIRYRMRLRSSANRFEVRQNYVPTFVDRIFGDLKEVNNQLDEAIAIMDEYYMQRDNLEALNELMISSSNAKKPFAALSAAQKSTFTRKYNSQNHPVLFHIGGETIKKKLAAPAEDREGEIYEEEPDFGADVSEEEDVEDETVDQDSLISESKKRKKAPGSSSGRSKKQKSKK
ncbi:replication factor RFC1 C terminal domain-containing protein [Phascolomyces articulosus]|uniref:Replication factor C subunit 1 n=1 Tax=Phascolomyces articulosus TaxID=60185 RepID=A0AAD5K4W0_9FUNG|nr:replication factor RFC1 C terminal domain-containing protein [Phascolomyces articulosus]